MQLQTLPQCQYYQLPQKWKDFLRKYYNNYIAKFLKVILQAENCKDPVAKKLLILDREAYVHRFLHLLAYKLAHSTSAQEVCD